MRNKILLGVILLLLFAGGCTKKNDDVVKIGVISVFSGKGANYGKAARTGIDLAVEEINKMGGIEGKKIEIIYEDSKGEPKDALNAFQKLVNVDKVQIVIGPFYSGEVLSCAPEAEKNKVVLISGSATSDNITKAGDYIFRVCPTNELQAKTIANFCIYDLKVKNAFILYRNVDYGVTLRDAFVKNFTELGGVILGDEAVNADATDVRSQLNILKSKNPDVVFDAVHYTEGGTILRQAKELNINSIFIGTDGGFDPELIKIAGNSAEGSFWTTIGWGDSITKSLTEDFIKKYKTKYSEEPGSYSGLYYDAMMVIAEALKTTNFPLDGTNVKENLYLVKNYKGPTGITSFDLNGEVDKPFSIYQIRNGKFAFIK